jgi:adenosylmethionine-8-amino-7-oxononanoate aminotransferase
VYDAVDEADTFSHGFTWSHHPVGAAVADAVLSVIHDEGLVARSATLGERCRKRMHEALGDHPNVGDVRGIGLMNAVELVADRSTKQPFARSDEVTERVTMAAFGLGLTVYPCTSAVDGDVGDALMLGPALTVAEDELDEMVDRLAAAVRATLG